MQVRLTWRGAADLDLAVTEPGAFTISYSDLSSPGGGTLDVDANAGAAGRSAATKSTSRTSSGRKGSRRAGPTSRRLIVEPLRWPGPTYELRITVGGRVVHEQRMQFSVWTPPVSFTGGS